MAPVLGIETTGEQEKIIAAVRDRLDQEEGWLLIFDNAEDARSIRPYLPLQRRGG